MALSYNGIIVLPSERLYLFEHDITDTSKRSTVFMSTLEILGYSSKNPNKQTQTHRISIVYRVNRSNGTGAGVGHNVWGHKCISCDIRQLLGRCFFC